MARKTGEPWNYEALLGGIQNATDLDELRKASKKALADKLWEEQVNQLPGRYEHLNQEKNLKISSEFSKLEALAAERERQLKADLGSTWGVESTRLFAQVKSYDEQIAAALAGVYDLCLARTKAQAEIINKSRVIETLKWRGQKAAGPTLDKHVLPWGATFRAASGTPEGQAEAAALTLTGFSRQISLMIGSGQQPKEITLQTIIDSYKMLNIPGQNQVSTYNTTATTRPVVAKG